MPRKRKEQLDGSNFKKAFPAAMRKLMEDKGVTQNALADYIGKTRQAVSYYCDGSSSPDWETLAKIAEFFDVSTDYLVGRTDEPSRAPCAVDQLGLSPDIVNWITTENSDPDIKRSINAIFRIPSFRSLVSELCNFYFSARAERIYDDIEYDVLQELQNDDESEDFSQEFRDKIKQTIEAKQYGDRISSLLSTHSKIWNATKATRREYGHLIQEGFTISAFYMLKVDQRLKKVVSDIKFLSRGCGGGFNSSKEDKLISILNDEHKEMIEK